MTNIDKLEEYKNKLDLEKYMQTINMLKEDNEKNIKLSVSQRVSHHVSWDHHILTLSTAALGFVFGVLPLSNWGFLELAIIAAAMFVLAITFAMACFLFADSTFESSAKIYQSKSDLIGAAQDNYDMREFIENLNEPDVLNDEGLNHALKLEEDAGKALKKFNYTVIKEAKLINDNVDLATQFNQFKTYSFLIGLICITIYVFKNM